MVTVRLPGLTFTKREWEILYVLLHQALADDNLVVMAKKVKPKELKAIVDKLAYTR